MASTHPRPTRPFLLVFLLPGDCSNLALQISSFKPQASSPKSQASGLTRAYLQRETVYSPGQEVLTPLDLAAPVCLCTTAAATSTSHDGVHSRAGVISAILFLTEPIYTKPSHSCRSQPQTHTGRSLQDLHALVLTSTPRN